MESDADYEKRRLAILESMKRRHPPPNPNIKAVSLNSSTRWPENQLHYAIPFRSIQSNKLMQSPHPTTGNIVNDPYNTILYLHHITGIAALGYGSGYTHDRHEGTESVVWLSGPNMGSSAEQRAHAAELLGVDPSAIVQMYNC